MDRRTAKRVSLGILAAGLLSAAVLFVAMPENADDPMQRDPLAEKKYLRQLERIGGKANVLSSEIREWLDSLWHGKRLAATVAVSSAVVAWGFWFFMTLPPLEPAPTPEKPREP